jgi:hypothetical protein
VIYDLTLREQHGLRVRRIIFGPKREEVTKTWRKFVHQILYMSWRVEMCTKFVRKHEGKRTHGRILKRTLKNLGVNAWTGFIWLITASTGGLS